MRLRYVGSGRTSQAETFMIRKTSGAPQCLTLESNLELNAVAHAGIAPLHHD